MAFLGLRWPLWLQSDERVFTSGIRPDELANIDHDVTDFMRKYDIPGISIAITRRGRLVYAKGYGVTQHVGRDSVFIELADRRVNVWNLFRIASVSKPITSVTIMRLVEQGLIKLETRVFGDGGVLGNDFGFEMLPSGQNKTRLGDITVQHLLEHASGGWSNDPNPGDPMFAHREMDHKQLIKWVLENRPLDHAPGTTFAYSNFGYCLLGRIIEKVSGQTYADYVKAQILRRCDITNMHIAGNTFAERRSDEVVYHARPLSSPDPYGIPVARMDSHGGWIASAVDLVRFAVHVDGFNWFIDEHGGKPFVPTITPSVPDILNPDSIAAMTTKTTAKKSNGDDPNYAKGWDIHSGGRWSHGGSLPGTTSILVRTGQGFCWAGLVNAGDDHRLVPALDDLMWTIFGRVTRWPTHDLFPRYDGGRWGWVSLFIGKLKSIIENLAFRRG